MLSAFEKPTRWLGRFLITRFWTFLAGCGVAIYTLTPEDAATVERALTILGLLLLDAFSDAFGFGGS